MTAPMQKKHFIVYTFLNYSIANLFLMSCFDVPVMSLGAKTIRGINSIELFLRFRITIDMSSENLKTFDYLQVYTKI